MTSGMTMEEQIREMGRQLQLQEETVQSLKERLGIAETEKQLLEKKLDRVRIMENLGAIAAGTAHDLNNILSGIATLPDLLLFSLDLNERQKRAVEMIRQSGRRAVELVAELAILARGRDDETETLDMNTLVKNCLMSPEFKGIQKTNPLFRMRTELADEPLRLKGSFGLICKALTNLIVNAAADLSRNPLEENGLILIRTRRVDLDQTLRGFADWRPGRYVVLEVSDNGAALSESDRAGIFNPFYTRKVMGRNGTGLEMTIVRHVVLAHHGHIEIRTGAEGTGIEMYFPHADGSA